MRSILRLGSSCVGPPMPRVKNQGVHSSPCIAALYGIKLQNWALVLINKIHQVWCAVQQYFNSKLLHPQSIQTKLQFN
jgi:hypothetical protein